MVINSGVQTTMFNLNLYLILLNVMLIVLVINLACQDLPDSSTVNHPIICIPKLCDICKYVLLGTPG